MDKLLNDPIVMAQCAKLLANPTIMKQMGELLNNPDKVASLTDMFLRDAPAKFPSGTKIRVSGLSKQELNGLEGTVSSYDAATERYIVVLDDPTPRQIAVKDSNCTELDA